MFYFESNVGSMWLMPSGFTAEEFGRITVGRPCWVRRDLPHERAHFEQMRDVGPLYFPSYISEYLGDALVGLGMGEGWSAFGNAYENVGYEKQAYATQELIRAQREKR